MTRPDLLTVTTDASFCDVTHLAAWAAHVRGPGLPVPRLACDLVAGWPEDNNAAELAAAAEGIALAVSIGARTVVLVTDSLVVARAARGEDLALGRRLAFGVLVRWGEALPQPLRLRVRQVPGHTPAADPRDTRAMRWCDAHARRAMRNGRGRIPRGDVHG